MEVVVLVSVVRIELPPPRSPISGLSVVWSRCCACIYEGFGGVEDCESVRGGCMWYGVGVMFLDELAVVVVVEVIEAAVCGRCEGVGPTTMKSSEHRSCLITIVPRSNCTVMHLSPWPLDVYWFATEDDSAFGREACNKLLLET